jgi:hypothetical protein
MAEHGEQISRHDTCINILFLFLQMSNVLYMSQHEFQSKWFSIDLCVLSTIKHEIKLFLTMTSYPSLPYFILM